LLFLLVAVLWGCSWVGGLAHRRSGWLTILETNDLQSQIFPYREGEGSAGQVGGLARIATIISQVRKTEPAVVVLDGGDIFLAPSLRRYGGRPEIEAMNLIGYDCATIGNHEFDCGQEAFAHIVDLAEFPFVCANLDVSGSALLAGRIQPYIIREIGNKVVGIFGLVIPHLDQVTEIGRGIEVERDFLAKAAEVVAYLRPRVDILIALTHLGSQRDRELASSVRGIDVIVGAHSHEAFSEPIVVKDSSGSTTLIVQSGERGKFVGKLKVYYTNKGIKQWHWKLIKVDDTIEEDELVASTLKPFAEPKAGETLGRIDADLDLSSASVRCGEATIGTLLCQAVAEAFPYVSAVLINAGAIRGGFQPAGPISRSRIEQILPFNDRIVILHLSGEALKKVIERSVRLLPHENPGLLQLWGLRVFVDLSRPGAVLDSRGKIAIAGQRVKRIEVQGRPLVTSKDYVVATLEFLANGGDAYHELATARRTRTERTLNELFEQYIQKHSPVRPRVGGCLVLLGPEKGE